MVTDPYEIGAPVTKAARAQASLIRKTANLPINAEVLRDEFPGGYLLHDLVGGELLLVSGATRLRVYVVKDDRQNNRLVMDDYIPEAEADITIDEFGIVTGGTDTTTLEEDV